MKILNLNKKIYFSILLNCNKYLILKRLKINREMLDKLVQLKLFPLDQKELLKTKKDIKKINFVIQKLEKKLYYYIVVKNRF
jgi:hypothetical protein